MDMERMPSLMRSLWYGITWLVARLRGLPPPISPRDVERAREDMRNATPEDRAYAREVARRALEATGHLPPRSQGPSDDDPRASNK